MSKTTKERVSRNPSLHITREDFRYVLKELGLEKGFPINKFFEMADRFTIHSRAMIVSNRKSGKVARGLTRATRGDTYLAADIYYAVRKSLNHRGIRKPTQDSGRSWTLCRNLADICNEYCKEYNLAPREGFIEYMKIGFEIMGKNTKRALNVLPSMFQDIVDYKEAKHNLKSDKDQVLTEKIHDYYVSVIAERTGLSEDYTKDPAEYAHFIELKNYCIENNINYKDYIDALFEGLAWCNGLPEPARFLSSKSKQYYLKYMFKYKQKAQVEGPKVQGSLWNLINEDNE